MMKKILPAPLVSFGLFVVWLLLNRSLSPGHLLLALLLALGLPVLFTLGCARKGARAPPGSACCGCAGRWWWTTTQSNIAVLRFICCCRACATAPTS